jgi:hypothetical protein
MWQSWLNFFAGVWLIICAFVTPLRTPASMIAAGAVAFILGFWAVARTEDWKGAVNGSIGVWLLLSGIWFGILGVWNFLAFGVALAIFALWNIVQHPSPTHAPAH